MSSYFDSKILPVTITIYDQVAYIKGKFLVSLRDNRKSQLVSDINCLRFSIIHWLGKHQPELIYCKDGKHIRVKHYDGRFSAKRLIAHLDKVNRSRYSEQEDLIWCFRYRRFDEMLIELIKNNGFPDTVSYVPLHDYSQFVGTGETAEIWALDL